MVNRGNTKLIYKHSLLLIRTYSPVHTRRNTKERIKLETISEGETRMNSLSSLQNLQLAKKSSGFYRGSKHSVNGQGYYTGKCGTCAADRSSGMHATWCEWAGILHRYVLKAAKIRLNMNIV